MESSAERRLMQSFGEWRVSLADICSTQCTSPSFVHRHILSRLCVGGNTGDRRLLHMPTSLFLERLSSSNPPATKATFCAGAKVNLAICSELRYY